MQRIAAVLVVLALLAVGVAAPVAGAAAGPSAAVERATGTVFQSQANETPASNAPGARLGGFVAVQREEVQGDLERRTFDVRIGRAHSDSGRAAVVADQVRNLSRRTSEIKDRRRALVQAHDNGSITTTRFHAEMAALVARTGSVHAQLNRTEAASRGLPDEELASRGVNATAIERLKDDARNLSGPEDASIARSIAGRNVGGGLVGPAPPGNSEETRRNGETPTNRGPPRTPELGTVSPNGTPPVRTPDVNETPPGTPVTNETPSLGTPGENETPSTETTTIFGIATPTVHGVPELPNDSRRPTDTENHTHPGLGLLQGWFP